MTVDKSRIDSQMKRNLRRKRAKSINNYRLLVYNEIVSTAFRHSRCSVWQMM